MRVEEVGLTRIAPGHDSYSSPGYRLEEVVRARNEVETVAHGNGALSCTRRAKVTECDVRVEVGELGELAYSSAQPVWEERRTTHQENSETRPEEGGVLANSPPNPGRVRRECWAVNRVGKEHAREDVVVVRTDRDASSRLYGQSGWDSLLENIAQWHCPVREPVDEYGLHLSFKEV